MVASGAGCGGTAKLHPVHVIETIFAAGMNALTGRSGKRQTASKS